ncbi:MAG TPA: peptidoglycan bridge formation glycyltransferase FemA/FemB family protein [Candidatus Saccharimonadales bacterium]|nr:peptidoglycan bridge formation glycyltransferase FemA/FemB family protein [Candidatus Saccharimonadales bacterium]
MTTLKVSYDKQQWDDYVLEHDGHPLQLWGWGNVKADHGWTAERLLAFNEDSVIVGAVQLLLRRLPPPLRSIAYVPRGPIADGDDREAVLSALVEYTKRVHHSVVLTIEPDSVDFVLPQGWIRSENRILPSRTVILNLDKSEPELLNDMAKKTRQYIRKSASEAMVIRPVTTREELDKCLAIYHATAKRAKFQLHSDHYYYDVFDKLGEYSQLYAAYVDDSPIAFLWLAISADTAFELYGGMNDLGQQLRANYALKWHVIRKCKEWGLSRYDFGGLIGEGVTTFKKGWTTEETDLAGTFDMPLSSWYGTWNKTLPKAKKIVQKLKSLRR